MDFNLAKDITGGLSEPSKMPCYAFSTPAQECKIGKILRRAKNSICSICYAMKGRYSFGVVKAALARRFIGLNHPSWIQAIVFLILKQEKSGFFRWHDSGDIQDVAHLVRIVEVCKLTPDIQHWLPTREYSMVARYVKEHGAFPSNLTVRLSAYMVDGPPPTSLARRLGVFTSGVASDAFTCPSSSQGGKCVACRACWEKEVSNINYKVH